MLEGKTVNLKVVEKEDLPLLAEWFSSPEFAGRYNPLDAQESKMDIEKRHEKLGSEKVWFLILKKDGSRIGYLGMGLVGPYWEIGYALISSERGKGYCADAVQLAVDYLFMSKDIVRIQATTHIENVASQKILDKAGFQREGKIRKGMYAWGNWVDLYLYSILREEWKEPRILTKTA
jgi:ribosomal-protein-alanine N-acetyltransferase